MNAVLVPAVLSGAFKVLNANGEVSRSGYFFQVHLPDPAGAGVPEPQAGYADDGTLDGDLAETTWCCYAWPVNYNQSGNRTFFVNQAGDVLGCEDPNYDGPGSGPAAHAAFQNANEMTGATAIGTAGQNGTATAIWRQVN